MKILALTTAIALSSAALMANAASAVNVINPLPTNHIDYYTSAQSWVSATTAEVSVAVHAALSDRQLAGFQQTVLKNLKKIANVKDWHIVQFQQSQSNSGLENVNVLAQARIPASMLAQLNQQTDRLSTRAQGISYKINQINFTPSFAQIEATKDQLRQKLYKNIDQELKQTNRTFGNDFHIGNIDFTSQYTPPPRPRPMMTSFALAGNGMKRAAPAPSVAVSKKITLSAKVSFVNHNK